MTSSQIERLDAVFKGPLANINATLEKMFGIIQRMGNPANRQQKSIYETKFLGMVAEYLLTQFTSESFEEIRTAQTDLSLKEHQKYNQAGAMLAVYDAMQGYVVGTQDTARFNIVKDTVQRCVKKLAVERRMTSLPADRVSLPRDYNIKPPQTDDGKEYVLSACECFDAKGNMIVTFETSPPPVAATMVAIYDHPQACSVLATDDEERVYQFNSTLATAARQITLFINLATREIEISAGARAYGKFCQGSQMAVITPDGKGPHIVGCGQITKAQFFSGMQALTARASMASGQVITLEEITRGEVMAIERVRAIRDLNAADVGTGTRAAA